MAEQSTKPPSEWLEPIDHEIPSGVVARVLVVLLLVTIASFAAAWGFYEWFGRSEAALDPQPSPLLEAREVPVPAGPRLQVNPEQELALMRAADREYLTGWGWVDRTTGVARVPIDRSIEAVAAAGRLPEFGAATAATPTEEPTEP